MTTVETDDLLATREEVGDWTVFVKFSDIAKHNVADAQGRPQTEDMTILGSIGKGPISGDWLFLPSQEIRRYTTLDLYQVAALMLQIQNHEEPVLTNVPPVRKITPDEAKEILDRTARVWNQVPQEVKDGKTKPVERPAQFVQHSGQLSRICECGHAENEHGARTGFCISRTVGGFDECPCLGFKERGQVQCRD